MRFTLPTEAQWEPACRAGTTPAFSSGDGDEMLGEFAWFSDNSQGMSHAVGQLKPNAWALHDMHGNVWDWCADWYAADYYQPTPLVDPCGPPTGSTRIFRGGSWGAFPCSCRSAFRRNITPDYRYQTLGCRLAAVLGDESSSHWSSPLSKQAR